MTDFYDNLNNALLDIIKTFDPLIPKNPLLQDESEVQYLIKSFIMLCHAEIEKYFEDLASNVIDKCKIQYDEDSGNIKYPLLCLSLMAEKNFSKSDKNYLNPKDRLSKLISNFIAAIKQNNGIKESNIKELFAPLGINVDDIDPLFLERLNTLGALRGEIAHRGQIRLSNLLNYSEKKEFMQRLISDIKINIDSKMEVYV